MSMKLGKIVVTGLIAVSAISAIATPAFAKHGADDPVGVVDDRGGHGADDGPNHR